MKRLPRLDAAGRPEDARRFVRLAWVIGALFALLAARLAYLQIVRGREYQELSRANSIRLIPKRANRGLVLGRQGTVLARNVPAYSVLLIPSECRDLPRVASQLAVLLHVDADAIVRKVVEQRRFRGFEPVRIRDDLDRALAAAVEERKPELSGVVVQEEPRRFYVFGNFLSHVMGYVGEISGAQLSALRGRGYSAGDAIGQAGIEKVYDMELKGRSGGAEIQVNSRGQHIRVIAERKPQAGYDLALSVDEDVQRVTEEALEEVVRTSGASGAAAVALDPRNGEVLALASKPDYNPNDLSGGMTQEVWQHLQAADDYPMLSRAHQGTYPPGSTFKIVTAAACLEEGVLNSGTAFGCEGMYWIKTWPYKCWRLDGHGWSSMSRALVHSCDIFFYQAGIRLTVRPLAKWARRYGLGFRTGVDLSGENAGFVPDPEWKERTFHLPWFPGNTVQFSIGQSYLLATPLQMARTVAAFANGGTLWKPHVVREVRGNGAGTRRIEPTSEGRVELHGDTLELIRKAMWGVVNVPGGTGWRARLLPAVEVAGKTGTAQNAQNKLDAWFLCYAPFRDPTIAVAVVVENSGEGNVYAAPVARRILQAHFRLPIAKEKPVLPPSAITSGDSRTGD